MKKSNFFKNIKRTWKYIKDCKFNLIGYASVSIIEGIIEAVLPLISAILFDEATSALDNETQSEIHKAIQNMKGEYTILIIAHRLSTVIDSNKIFVVDDGKIIASGTHKDLLKKCDFYKNLYDKDLQVN